MDSAEFYCPWCGLTLNGVTHVDNYEAWELYNCEYNSERSGERPVTEIERNNRILAELNEERNAVDKKIWTLKVRNLKLIQLN